MTQRQDDQYDWTRLDRPTETEDTGPPGAAVGSWFVYAEGSSPTNPRDRAVYVPNPIALLQHTCVIMTYTRSH